MTATPTTEGWVCPGMSRDAKFLESQRLEIPPDQSREVQLVLDPEYL